MNRLLHLALLLLPFALFACAGTSTSNVQGGNGNVHGNGFAEFPTAQGAESHDLGYSILWRNCESVSDNHTYGDYTIDGPSYSVAYNASVSCPDGDTVVWLTRLRFTLAVSTQEQFLAAGFTQRDDDDDDYVKNVGNTLYRIEWEGNEGKYAIEESYFYTVPKLNWDKLHPEMLALVPVGSELREYMETSPWSKILLITQSRRATLTEREQQMLTDRRDVQLDPAAVLRVLRKLGFIDDAALIDTIAQMSAAGELQYSIKNEDEKRMTLQVIDDMLMMSIQ
ncbi:MAG: hypothetical protein LBV04_09795 [Deferribacteraceae bacterium]|jgi:hypothetical protein|nr:hypothetical protein [Deferribacteraceae bacterium]